MEQLMALARHNAELRFKDRVLSDAVQIHNYQLQIARTGSHTPAPFPLPIAAGGSAAATAAAGGAAAARGAQPWEAATSVAQAVRLPGGAPMLLAEELLPSVDTDSVRSMGRLQLVEAWRAFLSEVSGLLLTLESSPDDEAAAVQLRGRTAKTAYLFRHASVVAPATLMAVMQTHLETGALATPPPGHWQRVLQVLELTPDQTADTIAVYGIFRRIMAGVLDERRAIKAHISDGLQARAADPRVVGARPAVPPEGEALPALERSMRKEGAAHLLVRGFLFGRTLSILQFARAAVHAYPFFPSATGLAAAAAGVVE